MDCRVALELTLDTAGGPLLSGHGRQDEDRCEGQLEDSDGLHHVDAPAQSRPSSAAMARSISPASSRRRGGEQVELGGGRPGGSSRRRTGAGRASRRRPAGRGRGTGSRRRRGAGARRARGPNGGRRSGAGRRSPRRPFPSPRGLPAGEALAVAEEVDAGRDDVEGDVRGVGVALDAVAARPSPSAFFQMAIAARCSRAALAAAAARP